jgi:hypothetical protein
MNHELTRLIGNLTVTFHGMSLESLYQVARALRHELAARELDCTPEADALVCALLAHAQVEHRAIYSDDCRPAE